MRGAGRIFCGIWIGSMDILVTVPVRGADRIMKYKVYTVKEFRLQSP